MVFFFYRGRVCAPSCVRRKSIERKTSQEKREREPREHADDAKKKEKEKPPKEEVVAKRPDKDKEMKKVDPVTVKKPESSVSPKKLQVSSLPVTRHRVSSHLNKSVGSCEIDGKIYFRIFSMSTSIFVE